MSKLVLEPTWKIKLPDDRITIHGGTKEFALEAAIQLFSEHARENIKIETIEGFKEDEQV